MRSKCNNIVTPLVSGNIIMGGRMQDGFHMPGRCEARDSSRAVKPLAVMAASLWLGLAVARANPEGMVVKDGNVSFTIGGNVMTINASQNARINWQSFNIASGETTTFVQPSAGSVVWNTVNVANPAQIYGHLNANGIVVLVSPGGIWFGPDAVVKTGGFIASTALPTPSFNPGSQWQFDGPPPTVPIINYGKINVAAGGSLFLIADRVENHGTLNAPGGNIGIGAGREIYISDRPDGRGLNITVDQPQGLVNNDGKIIADAGTIVANTRTLNQSGLVQANSVREQNGVIEFVAGDAVNLGAGSVTRADGDSAGVSAGGQITIKSANAFSDATSSVVSAQGGSQAGNGGALEISAPNILSLDSELTAAASPGFVSGTLSLDPTTINLGTTGTGSAGNGTVSGGAGTLNLNVNTAFNHNFSVIDLQATGNINLLPNTAWILSGPTQPNQPTTGQLTLEAGGNIFLESGSSISDANGWSITLNAGVTFKTTPHSIIAGTGTIYVNGADGTVANAEGSSGGGSIGLNKGNLTLNAGKSIQVGAGPLADMIGYNYGLFTQSGTITLGTATQTPQAINVVGLVESVSGDVNLTAKQILTGPGQNAILGFDDNGESIFGPSLSVQSASGNLNLSATGTVATSAPYLNLGSGLIDTTAGGNIMITSGNGIVENTAHVSTSSSRDGTGNVVKPAGSVSLTATTGSLNLESEGVVSSDSGTVTLGAGQDINVSSGFAVSTTTGIIKLNAGGSLNFGSSQDASTGQITSGAGAINLTAQQDITLFTGGYVTTTGGGSITAHAVSGSIDAGAGILRDASGNVLDSPKNPAGYSYDKVAGAYVNANSLTGISTAAGGDVTLHAGMNVQTFLPIQGGKNATSDAGSGAFGPAPGNVTVISDSGYVTGHYVVANGTGTITANNGYAGGTAGLLALSLTKGSWTVSAPNGGIDLQEVRNPNGVFNQLSGSANHLFNYDPSGFVSLTAQSVELGFGGTTLPRTSDFATLPSIYPPTLDITAGNLGIKLDADVILFPSPQGSLNVVATGSLTGGKSTGTTQLIMSDSGTSQYLTTSTFGSADHAQIPVHAQNVTTCSVKVGGDMNDIGLVLPEPGTVTVGGNMVNCSLKGQNLTRNDATTFNVTGDILNDSVWHLTGNLGLGNSLDLSPLLRAAGDAQNLFNQLNYNPGTGVLAVYGKLNSTDLSILESGFQVQATDQAGRPLFKPDGITPILQTIYLFPVSNGQVTGSLKTALDGLYANSAFSSAQQGDGYVIGGPGQFNINARNLDLGETAGIKSVGPSANQYLAGYCYNPQLPYDSGASLNLDLSGNLTMFSSQISTVAGGSITINAGGSIVAGSTLIPVNDTLPRGIYTVASDVWYDSNGRHSTADINVTAGGDISLDASRLAAFDGGSVSVTSLKGNIDAGSGGASSTVVQEVIVVPTSYYTPGNMNFYDNHGNAGYKIVLAPKAPETIPGSGILTSTFPPVEDRNQYSISGNSVGNITVSALQGDVIANGGGISQFAYNKNIPDSAFINVTAGSTDPDGTVHAGNVNASDSGIIGKNIKINATGNITGTLVAFKNIDIINTGNIDVLAIGGGHVDFSSGGTVSGQIIGVGGISGSSSGTIQATLQSANVSTGGGGAVTGRVGLGTANVAGATSQAATSDSKATTQAVASAAATENDENRKYRRRPGLIKTGRVTVILPKS